ncbi:MAG: DNA repair protein RadC [Chloroflexota bacterium]|nr:DNA repair protein RadC [Chloroflexia bacterium]MDQ3444023.1 DNA repair protein RadC [Chloroflexota bacterium]
MPRERLEQEGAGVLADHELIAILLRTGTANEGVLRLSARLLEEYGGFIGLQRRDYAEFLRMGGLGPAKAATLKAALEIGRRVAKLPIEDRPAISSPEDVVNLIGFEMAALEQEQLRVVLLDTKNRIIRSPMVYQGSVNEASVRIGELFREAVRVNAVSIILVHNHPSGDPTPSGADVALTTNVVAAGKLLDIAVVDHLVIGQGKHVSLKRLGLGFART